MGIQVIPMFCYNSPSKGLHNVLSTDMVRRKISEIETNHSVYISQQKLWLSTKHIEDMHSFQR